LSGKLKTFIVPSSIRKEKTEIITELYSDCHSGKIKDRETGNEHGFVQDNICVNVNVGDEVTYIEITLPTGDVIIKEIKRKSP
jgi:hypothetical protein